MPRNTSAFAQTSLDQLRSALETDDKTMALQKYGRRVLQELSQEEIQALLSMSESDEQALDNFLYSSQALREANILAIHRTLYDSKRFDKILQFIPLTLKVKRKWSPDFVQSAVRLACLAVVESKQIGDPCVRIANAFTFDASHIYLDQKAYDARKGVERLGWSPLPVISDLPERVQQVYRHAYVALCISMNVAAGNENLVQGIRRSLDSEHFAAIEMLLKVFEEGHTSWLGVSYEENVEVTWATRTWSTLLRGLISKHHLRLAQKAWDTFNRCKPNDQRIVAPIWNSLLTGYADIGDWERAGQIWEMVGDEGRSDTHLITTMISTLFKARRPHEAILHFEQARQASSQRKQRVDVAVVNAYLFGLTINDQVDVAIKTLLAMAQRTDETLPLPDSRSFNIALRAVGRRGTPEHLTNLLSYMTECDVTPDKVTFTTVLDSLARMGANDTTSEVYKLMETCGVRANEVTLTALIKSSLELMDDDPKKGLMSALDLLQQMEVSGPAPTAVTYTAVMTAVRKDNQCVSELIKSGRMPSLYTLQSSHDGLSQYGVNLTDRWAKQPSSIVCLMLFERMKTLRVEPNRKTLHLLIHILVGEHVLSRKDQQLLGEGYAIVLKLFDRMSEPSRPSDKTALMLVGHMRAAAQANMAACKPHMLQCVDSLLKMCDADERVRKSMPAIIDAAEIVQKLA